MGCPSSTTNVPCSDTTWPSGEGEGNVVGLIELVPENWTGG
jgi:hypothetical protein